MTAAGKAVLAVVVGVPTLVLASCGVLMAIGSAGGDRGPSDVEVRNQCRDWVAERLVAPAEAEYSGETVSGDGPWVVSGEVDAPNRLGVTLRMSYVCDIRLDGSTWRGSATLIE